MPKGKIQMHSRGCSYYKWNSQLKPQRYWMPVEEKQVLQLLVFAGSRRTVSSAKELCGDYSISQHSRSPCIIRKLKGIWEVHWFMLAYEPRACSPSQITWAKNWGNHLLRGVYLNQRCTATVGLFGSESHNHRRKCPFSQSDNRGPTRPPSLASCKKVNNEAEAVKAFTNLTGKTVQETGLWLDGSGILGACPDGIVDEDSVLEAKCLYTERNMTIEEAVNISPDFCLKKTDSGQYALKEELPIGIRCNGRCIFLSGSFAIFLSGHLKM